MRQKRNISIQKPVNVLACSGSETYCHMMQVRTNEKDIFQLCLFILESEAVKHARFYCQKQTVIKATQQ